MRVQAATLYQTNTPLQVETLDLAEPGYGEVTVRLHASGVCHSDYHVINDQAHHDLPVVLGHEGAGTVIAIGEGVTRVETGDHVVLSWIPYCGTCFYCDHDMTHLCREYKEPLWAGTMLDGTCRFSKDGQPRRHLSMLATWASHAVVPEQTCVKIAREVPFEVAALLGCAVTTGVGAVLNKAQVKSGETVAVIGAGGVGLSVIMGAKLAGASRIAAVDINLEKEPLARQFGATDYFLSGPQILTEMRAITGGHGFDHVFEAVGSTKLQELALEMVRPGGVLTLVGLAGNDEKMALSGANLTRDEKTISGSVFGSANTDRDFNRYASLYLAGELPVQQLVERRYPLEDINQAVTDMVDGKPGRGVIVFD